MFLWTVAGMEDAAVLEDGASQSNSSNMDPDLQAIESDESLWQLDIEN